MEDYKEWLYIQAETYFEEKEMEKEMEREETEDKNNDNDLPF